MEENIYRKEASPEVDVAWEALGVDGKILFSSCRDDYDTHFFVPARPGIISEEQGRLSGLTSAHVRRAEKYGGGFFVNVEGLHHLHCLVRLPKRTCRLHIRSNDYLSRISSAKRCITTMITTKNLGLMRS